MIVVIGHRGARRRLGVARQRFEGFRLAYLEPAGLSEPGWAHTPGEPLEDRVVIGGERLAAASIDAVVTALDAVELDDLPHVRAEDRPFVAAEMTAFLRTWLGSLACPVLDRPTPLALSGPAGDFSVWGPVARAAGVCDRRGCVRGAADVRAVTVVAGRTIEVAPDGVRQLAEELVARAGATAARLTVGLAGRTATLYDAEPWSLTPHPFALRVLIEHAVRLGRGLAPVGDGRQAVGS